MKKDKTGKIGRLVLFVTLSITNSDPTLRPTHVVCRASVGHIYNTQLGGWGE